MKSRKYGLERVAAAGLCAVSLLLLCLQAAGQVKPANPDLIPEARRLLSYLHSVHGDKTLTGVSGRDTLRKVLDMSGRQPAILATDASGWNPPKWGDSYRRVVQGNIDDCLWWHGRGGIVSMQWHWMKPGQPNTRHTAWSEDGEPIEVESVLTPGTPEHKAAMRDLKRLSDHLQQLHEAHVPVLWRPLHEIDGGWFWWTDAETPENTAKLWRMIFDYMVHERGLDNLIWVYSAGLKPARGAGRGKVEKIDYRRRFYPGDEYVDIAGIDIYPNDYFGWPDFRKSSYPRAHHIIERVAPGRIKALCEGGGIPDPDTIAEEGPRWLYALQWWARDPSWTRRVYRHPQMLTLNELPAPEGHSVPPTVRLLSPADGARIEGTKVRLAARAADRDGRIQKVRFWKLPGRWRNWARVSLDERRAMLENAVMLAEGPKATWTDPPTGLHSIMATATDDDGDMAVSNIARLSTGLENYVHGAEVKVSSNEGSAPAAIDDDLFTGWNTGKEDGQWMVLDLGAPRAVGAVSLLWGRRHGMSYRIQAPDGDGGWQDLAAVDDGGGELDVVTFESRKLGHMRLKATKSSTDRGGYLLYDIAVYSSIPQ